MSQSELVTHTDLKPKVMMVQGKHAESAAAVEIDSVVPVLQKLQMGSFRFCFPNIFGVFLQEGAGAAAC